MDCKGSKTKEEKDNRTRWIPISEGLPQKPDYDWVLVKTEFNPEGWCGVPIVAELRNGVWYCEHCDGPMEETLSLKVIAWFPMESIKDPENKDTEATDESTMSSWAEREIEIACKRERAASDAKDGDWYYGCACYLSALKAFKSLSGDGHSGFSIGLTKNILNRLIDGKPLTPIEDTPDIWYGRSDVFGHHLPKGRKK